MRFFSSSALARAPKLRFAASCSAAETIFGFLPGVPCATRSLKVDLARTPDIIWCSASISPSSLRQIARRRRTMTQMLRRLAFVLCWRQDFHRAARLLDRRDRGFRSAVNLDRELGLEFTTTEQPHAGLRAPDHAGLHQRFGVDGVVGVEQLGVDRILNTVEIDLGIFDPEDVVEAALRQAPMQRHLAALKALDAHARTRGLALAAAARGLSLARADATPDAHPLFAGAGVGGDIAELHRNLPYLLDL